VTVRFRTAPASDDADALQSIAAATGVFTAEEVAFVPEILTALARAGIESGYALIVAEDDSGPVGFSIFGPIPGTENRFDLYWIATDPRAQGKGIGKALLERSREAAREAGASHMFIQTSGRADYAPARALYQRCGFRLVASIDDYYRDGDGLAIFGAKL
jgi:ribosomal protein S18 acetylase RimI-like enzyme